MRAFVTVMGKDKIGIIQKVTTVLLENRINILDINQTLIEDYFVMIMLIDLSQMSIEFSSLKEKLDVAGKEIGVYIKIQHEDIFNSMHKI